jgi:hypothetical protein
MSDILEVMARALGECPVDEMRDDGLSHTARYQLSALEKEGWVVVGKDAVLEVIRRRKAIYHEKSGKRAPFGEDIANAYDLDVHAATAMEYLEHEMTAMLSASPSGKLDR